MNLTLRRMEHADLPGVASLEEQLFREDAWSAGMLASELNGAPDRYYLIAEDEAGIAGYAGLLAPGGDQADVLTLAVAQHRWGEGIGATLLHALLAEAGRRECTEVYLEVRVDNERAQRLYRRNGFTAAGVRRGYYQPSGTDALVMRRVVGNAGRLAGTGDEPGESQLPADDHRPPGGPR